MFVCTPPLLAGECVVALANWLDSLVEGKWMNFCSRVSQRTTQKNIYKKGEEATCCYTERERVYKAMMNAVARLTLGSSKHNSSFFFAFYLYLISPSWFPTTKEFNYSQKSQWALMGEWGGRPEFVCWGVTAGVMDRWYAANARLVIHHTLGEGARIGITTRYIRCVDITKRK